MSRDETDRLEKMQQTLARIEGAVLGDEAAGHLGLVSRMNNHAKRIKKLELWVYRVGATALGVVSVITVAYKLLTDLWPRK